MLIPNKFNGFYQGRRTYFDGGGDGGGGGDGTGGDGTGGDAASSGEGPAAAAAAEGAMGSTGGSQGPGDGPAGAEGISIGDPSFDGGFYGGPSDPYNPAGDIGAGAGAGAGAANSGFPGISPGYQAQDASNRQLYQSVYQPQYTDYLRAGANPYAIGDYNTDMQSMFGTFYNPFSLAQMGGYGGMGGGGPQGPMGGYGGLGSLGGYGSYGGFGNYGGYGGIGDLLSSMMGGGMGGAPNYGIAGLYR